MITPLESECWFTEHQPEFDEQQKAYCVFQFACLYRQRLRSQVCCRTGALASV